MALCYTEKGKVWHHDITNGRGGFTLCGYQVQGYPGYLAHVFKDTVCTKCKNKLNGPKPKKIRR